MTKLCSIKKSYFKLFIISAFIALVNTNYAQILWVNFPSSTYQCDQEVPRPQAASICEVSVVYEEIYTTSECSTILTLISTATDVCGNTATRTDVITIVDTTSPFIVAPWSSLTINCDEELPPVSEVEVFDNCDENVEVSYTVTEYIEGCTRNIEYVFYAIDDCGNTSTATQVISIVDIVAPVITADPVIYSLTEPGYYATVTDNCSEDVILTYEILGTTVNSLGQTVQEVLYRATDACGNYTVFIQQWIRCEPTVIEFSHAEGGSLAGVGYIITDNTGTEVASGIASGGAIFTETNCLDNGCYHLTIINPNPMNPAISWYLSGAYGGTIYGFISLEYDFSIGGECAGVGCINPTSCNYNPFATIPGVCFSSCIRAEFADIIPPIGEQWGFEIAQINTNYYLAASLPYAEPLNLQPFTMYYMTLVSNGNNGWNGNSLTFISDDWNWSQQITYGAGDPDQIIFTTGGPGCTDPNACNYNELATVDDNSCLFPDGCTDMLACNFNPLAACDNGSCTYLNSAFSFDLEELEGWTALYLDRMDDTGAPQSGQCNYYRLTYPDGSFVQIDAASREDEFGILYYLFYSVPGTYTISYTDCCTGTDGSVYSSTTEQTFYVAPCNLEVAAKGWLSMSLFTVPGAYLDYQVYRVNDGNIVASGSHSFTDVQLFLTGECIDPGCYTLAVSMNYPMVFAAQWPQGDGFSSSEEGAYYYLIPFEFGVVEGCMDPMACNFNASANCNNQELCWTVYGCTDNAALNFNPAAQCNDGSCIYVQNDERAGAILAVVNNKGNCNQTKTGNLQQATTSASATSIAVTGEDLWYKFVAPEPGIAIRVTSSANDILIELQDAQGQTLDTENLVNGLGNEFLNYGQLNVGATYYVAVRNFNSQLGEGTFTLCLQMLRDSFCSSANSANPTPCTVFKATAVGSNFYNFHFTSLSTGITYDILNSGSQRAIWRANGIIPEQSYEVQIDAVYSMQNGTGMFELITVPGIITCQIYLNPNVPIYMNPIDNCDAGFRALNRTIKAIPSICGAVDYEWRFENQNGIQPVIEHLRGSNVTSIRLNTVPGIQTNSFYNVQVRPVYMDGSRGDYGPVQCLKTSGNRNMTFDSDFDDESNVEGAILSLYPNPSNGNLFFVNFGESTSFDGDIEIYDNMGRLVMQSKLVIESQPNVEIKLPESLSTGNYIVRLISVENVYTSKLVVDSHE